MYLQSQPTSHGFLDCSLERTLCLQGHSLSLRNKLGEEVHGPGSDFLVVA